MNQDEIRKIVEGRKVEEKKKTELEMLAAAQKKKKKGSHSAQHSDGKITSEFVLECLYANELGDGILFAAIHKKKFLNDGTWMVFGDHNWKEAIIGEPKSAVEEVALQYLKEAKNIGNKISEAVDAGDKETIVSLQKIQNNLHKRVFRLRSDRGRKACLEFARINPVNGMGIEDGKFNLAPMDYGCNNGKINLYDGELEPGRSEDMISKASPIDFYGKDTPAPNWDTFLNQIFDGNQSMIDYIRRMFGYCMTGLTVERFMPIMQGSGNNGKTTLVETVSNVFGPMAVVVRPELLLDQGRIPSSGAATPEIMVLRYTRIATASETDQGRRFSTSRVKWLIGSDSLTGRYLYEKRDVQFLPTHKLLLLTNHRPDVSGDDDSFWEKIHLIPFPLSFVLRKPEKDHERPADKYLRQKLLDEAPGILAWMVRGCLEWQERGLDPPPAVIDASREYRRDEDLIQHFVDDCCNEVKGAETTAKDLYDCFKKWWETNISRKPLSQKKFGGMLGKKFQRSKSGTCRYFGVILREDENWD